MIEIENQFPSSHIRVTNEEEQETEEEVYVEDRWTRPVKNAPLLRLTLKDDRHYGNCIPFLYFKGEPLILLGPDCKFL